MRIELNAKQSRSLAVAIFVCMLLVIYLIFINPIINQHDNYDEAISYLNGKLNKYQKLSRGKSKEQRFLQNLKRKTSTNTHYLRNKKPALAAAELQQHVRNIINVNGGQVISTQDLTDDKSDNVTYVKIRAHVKGDIRILLNMLYRFETGRPMVFLDNVVVKKRRNIRKRKSKKGEINDMDIRLDLLGYIRGGGQS